MGIAVNNVFHVGRCFEIGPQKIGNYNISAVVIAYQQSATDSPNQLNFAYKLLLFKLLKRH